MALSFLPDPLKLCREALNKVETGVNEYATRRMESKEFAQVVSQVSKVTLGVKHVSEKSISGVYRRLDIPTRAEVDALADALRRVEDKLDLLLPKQEAAVPRPARTRRPAVAEAAVEEKAKAPAKRAAKPKAKAEEKVEVQAEVKDAAQEDSKDVVAA
ncbi:hypothetical protein [Pseudomonas schmalbachii]|uniref:Poly(3-hydroxyalkanoate) granule-associated protein PhaI n=1 Tax=Pseudomonas schmalbachii TaxID=2816993 RepID=A0ABS3TWQ4_9PSED|nr:hypothetical protein [Pseudomonas schmalbachii]MBO3278116.1 hypothetical protein [Pseudomonas schmalbachii]